MKEVACLVIKDKDWNDLLDFHDANVFAQTDASSGPKLRSFLASGIVGARNLAYCEIALLHSYPSGRVIYEPSLRPPEFCVLAERRLVPIHDIRATTHHSPSRKKVAEYHDAAFWYDPLEW